MKKDLSTLAQELIAAKHQFDAITRYVDSLPKASSELRVRVEMPWASASIPDGHKAVCAGLERRFNIALREEIAAVQVEARRTVAEAQNALIAAVSALQSSSVDAQGAE